MISFLLRTLLGIHNIFESTVCHSLNLKRHRFTFLHHLLEAWVCHYFFVHLVSVCSRLEDDKRKHDRLTWLYLDRFAERRAEICLLYTSPSPRDRQKSRMPSSA